MGMRSRSIQAGAVSTFESWKSEVVRVTGGFDVSHVPVMPLVSVR